MSYATDALLQALHYDPIRQTCTLSAEIARLGESRQALRTAFGQEPIEVTNVAIIPSPPQGAKGTEVLAIQGVCEMFGHHSREIYLECVLAGGEVQTLLVLIPLPERGWQLATGFPAIKEAPMMQGGLSLRDGVIVVSYGLSRMAESRTVFELDRSKDADEQEAGSDEPVRREVALAGYVLQDGLQIFADGLVNGSRALPDKWWQDFADAAALPDQAADPARVAIRGDVADGWLHLECWWDEAAALEGTGETSSHKAGLAIHYDLKNPNEGFHYWLREIRISDELAAEPIILEAHVSEGFTPRYATRMGRLIPLGESLAALSSLIGSGVASQIVAELALELPDALSLISFIYSPGQWMLFTVGAGDHATAEKHLCHVGPFDLSEVDFTFAIPLPLGQESPTVELTGFMAIADVHFQIHARTWDLIEGTLDEPDGVHLGQFIENLLPIPLPFRLNTVTLRQAKLQRLLPGNKDGEATNRLQIKLDGQVDLVPTFAAGAIVLDAITLDIHKPDQGKALGSIGALLTLGPVTLSVDAERTADGWLFEGIADAPPEGISLTKLVDHLVHAFGAAVPAEIPDVSLERISLSYDTADRRLELQAITDWKIADDVPVLGGSASKAILQLIVARDPQQGKTHATFSVNLTLEKEVETNGQTRSYELEAQALLAADAQSFGFDFDAPEGDPLLLSDVATGLGLDIPTAGAHVLDAVFQVASLSMSYARPGNAFDVAWSRPLGEGMLLAEYSQSGSNQPAQAGGSAQSGATSRVVEVSWLGDDDDSTLGIQDILGLVGQGHLEDDLKDLVGDEIVAKIDDFLSFKQLGFSWQENDQQNTLTFTALSKSQAQAFIAVRSGENAGLVAGIAFAGSDEESTHADAQDLTFLPEAANEFLKVVEKVLEHIELTHFLFSTVSSSAYQPPAFAASAMQPSYARQDGDAPSTPFGAGTMTLGRGVSVGARVKFGPHDIVRRVIAVDEIDGQVTIGDVIALQVAIPGSLKLDAGGGNSLALSAPVLRIKENLEIPEAGPEFDIQGGLDIHFAGQRLQMTGWIALAEEALTGHVQLTELSLPIPLTPIAMLPGVQLVINKDKPLSLDLGLQFEPSGLDLGLSGSFAIYKDDKDLVYGDAGFVLELVEEVPQPLYVEFGADELSIPVLLEAVTGVQYRLHLADAVAKLAAASAEVAEAAADEVGDLAGGEAGSDVKAASEVADQAAKGASTAIEAAESALGHLEAILSKVELRDVRFHWADSIVNLPDGSTVMPGIGIRGGLRIFDWDAFAVLDLSMQGIPGFSGHLEAEKIEIGRILKIWGDGQGIHKTPTTAEDFNQQVKSKVQAMAAGQPRLVAPAAAKDEGVWFLEPGGPVLHLSTRSSPFLHADLHAQLFGFLQTDIHADITDEGFDFDFKISAGNAVTAELECHWWHKEGKLEAHGDLGIHLHGDIGPIIPHVAATQFHLDTDLDAHVSLMVDSEEFKLTVNGSFAYQGASLHLPELVLEERFSALEELAKKVWEHVVAEAENIFAEYLAPIGKFVEEGAKEVAQVAVAAAKEVAEAASAAAGEAKQIVSDVAETMDKAAGEIGQAAENLAGEAETLASNAAQAALDAAAPLLDKVSDLSNKALQFAADAADSVKAIVADVAVLVSEAAQYAIQVAAEAAQWVAEKLDEARRWVSARLDQAIALVNQLAQEAEAAVRAIEADIEEVERKIEELFSRAAEKVEDTLSSGWHAATSWL